MTFDKVETMKSEFVGLDRRLCRKLFLTAQILLICTALVPHQVFGQQTVTLSVDPSSVVVTYPTFTIDVVISPVTDLWQIRFTLSFNDYVDFVEVPTGGVEPGDLFAGLEPDLSTGEYQISDLSYLEVLIEMPGNETVTSSESKSLAKITFKLLDNAMPGMTSWLKLEWADATFYTGSGEIPYEYVDSESGMTLQSGTVTLDYLTTTLTANPAIATVEEHITLSSTLKDGDGNPIGGLSVNYYVDSLEIGSAVTNDFGVSSISYNSSNVGTFTITAEHVGNLPGGKYAGSSDTATLTVNRMNTTLTLIVKSSIKIMETVDLVATLKKDGTSMSGETLKFYVNSTEEGSEITDANGVASIQFSFSGPGTYEIKAEYSGTTKYAPSSDTTTRRVAVTRTHLESTVTPPIAKVDQGVTLSATLKDEGDSPISGKTIEYYVDGEWVGSDNTDVNGFSSIAYTPSEASPPDGWEIEARYGGDQSYSSSVDTATLVVNRLSTTLALSVEPTTLTIEQAITMTATLKDENTKAIPGSNIDYYIKGEDRWTKTGNTTTDINGKASLVCTPTTTGTLLVKANYTGSQKYFVSNSESTILTVNKLATTLTLTMLTTAKLEQTTMISATLEDENQKTISAVTIEFYLVEGVLEETIGTAKTNQNGVASLPYTTTNVGTFQIKAIYSGSTEYLGSSDSKDLTVDPLTTILTLNVVDNTEVGDTITLVATLEDENKNALKGFSIEYFVQSDILWSSMGTAVTNSSGVATKDFTLSEAGTFLLKAVFTGDSKYARSISEEATIEADGASKKPWIDLSFLADTRALLFWWLIFAVLIAIIFLVIWRAGKSDAQKDNSRIL